MCDTIVDARCKLNVWNFNWIALQRKSASPVEIHAVFCCLRHNGLEQYTSSFLKRIRTDVTFNLTCVLGSIINLEFCIRSLRHSKNDDYQNGLADFLCKAIHIGLYGCRLYQEQKFAKHSLREKSFLCNKTVRWKLYTCHPFKIWGPLPRLMPRPEVSAFVCLVNDPSLQNTEYNTALDLRPRLC